MSTWDEDFIEVVDGRAHSSGGHTNAVQVAEKITDLANAADRIADTLEEILQIMQARQ